MTLDNFLHLTLLGLCSGLACWLFLTALELHNCRERIENFKKQDKNNAAVMLAAQDQLNSLTLELRKARAHWNSVQKQLEAEIQQWQDANRKLEEAELERSKAAATILDENDVLTTQREELLAHLREIQLRVNAALSPFETPF